MSHNNVNDFNECLKFSHKFEDHPVWSRVYKAAFPNIVGTVSYQQDGFWQREGVDRGIMLSTTKQILVDEKVRGRNKITGRVYDDILLEYKSTNTSAGWVCKPLRADYIAYLIAPLGVCYMLPVIQMQNAWEKNKAEWFANAEDRSNKGFQKVSAKNNGYTTLSLAVPVNVLFPAMGGQLRVKFNKFEID